MNKIVARNRRASHDWVLGENLTAGMVLHGWEVKAVRSGKASVAGSYVTIKDGEVWLIGSRIEPLSQAQAMIPAPEPDRTRKLLLSKREISRLIGAIKCDGISLIPLEMFWVQGKLKLNISLSKGRKKQDYRMKDKEASAKREADRAMKVKFI